MRLSLFQKLALFTIKLGIGFLAFIERVELAAIRTSQVSILLVSILFLGLFVKFSDPLLAGLFVEYGFETDPLVLNANAPGVSTKNIGPVLTKEIEPPLISAKSALAIDKTANRILYELNANQKLAPASTTKLMTAYVALTIYGIDDVLTVPETCSLVQSQKAGLIPLKKYTVKDLVFTLLVGSAGDSACTLATAQTPDTEFVKLMNKYANKFGMENTNFTNPIGLDGENRSHYSTAADLYKLAREATKNDLITEAVKTQQYIFPVPDSPVSVSVFTTNELLLEIPESVGIKTGTTEEAGQVLIYQYKKDKQDIIIVVMGSTDSFSDTKSILNWVLESYVW